MEVFLFAGLALVGLIPVFLMVGAAGSFIGNMRDQYKDYMRAIDELDRLAERSGGEAL
jgi:uncharacterized membrane protein SpoIIM required for sporulation